MRKYILFVLLTTFILSCDESETPVSNTPENKDSNTDKYDPKAPFTRKVMLSFWANEMIKPAYANYKAKTSSLKTSAETFVTSPSVASLKSMRSKWKDAYISWQKVSPFQIGKAETLNLTSRTNVYPTNIENLKKSIDNAGSIDFTSPETYSVQGLPAIDYMINGINKSKNDDEIVAAFKAKSNNGVYLKKLVNSLSSLATEVNADWTGDFKNKFINDDGNTSESSVNKMINYYVIPFYEKQIREPKIAIPLGKRNDGVTQEAKVEAYYAKTISKELHMVALNATINFYKGISFDGKTTGKSLKQYLVFLKKDELAKEIEDKLSKVKELSGQLEDNLYLQLKKKRNLRAVHDLFDALQAVLKRFKPDMMTAMGIKNTSTDSDND